MTQPLDSRPIRRDLTDRELTRIIGGLLGGVSGMCDLDQLRNAVRWWASELAYMKTMELQLMTSTCVYCGAPNLDKADIHRHGSGKCTASKVNK